MSVLDRAALEASPLADLHTIASELSIDGYRRLRKADLIARILESQGGDAASQDDGDTAAAPSEEAGAGEPSEDAAGGRRRRGRRGGRGRSAAEDEAVGDGDAASDPAPAAAPPAADEPAPPSRRRREREDDEVVEGVVELLANGSGFVRVDPPDPSDDDVYISAAQVKRCELVSGDRIAGPKRTPRRSERFASLVRIDTINGRPADEQADGGRFEDLPVAFPSERLKLDSEDPTLKAIEWLTPFGRGSRVTIVGASRAGKTEALRRLAEQLAGQDDLQVTLALSGVRPEEIAEWSGGPVAPVASLSFAASADAQSAALELAVDQARRIASRGAHAVLLIDTLDGVVPHAARRILAAARNLVDRGSLTIIATATHPVGGETTVIALDIALASTGRYPALDLGASGTLRPELLVGDAAAEAIARARAEALDG